MSDPFPVKKREELLRQRIEQMRRNDEWHLFQDFCLGLLRHEGYTDVRLSNVRNDYGKDAVARHCDGRSCFVAVSFESLKRKVMGDAKRWAQDPKREAAELMVFMTWGNPTETTLSAWRKGLQHTHSLELVVFNKKTLLSAATKQGVWKETCERLGISGCEGIDPEKAAELRSKYCEWLVGKYEKIDFAGYLPGATTSAKPLFLPLEDIFVPLKVRETFARPVSKPEREREKPDIPERRSAHEPPEPDVAELYERERKREESRVLEVAEALANNLRAVILGDPGAGKSTLLKYITLAYARGFGVARQHVPDSESRTPILVSVAALSKDPNGLLPHIANEIGKAALSAEMTQLVRSDIQSGRAVILLDGLDELLTMSDRLQMVRQIQSFVAAHPKNRYIISSRIIGYNEAPVGPDFNEFTVEPFDDPAIETFSKKWSVALERLAGGDSPEAIQKGEQAGRDLHEAIMRNPGVRSLARNPLMLTILSLIHRQGKKMPSRRIELYAQCTKTLIESWCVSRDISRIPVGEALDERDILDVLCPVAFQMHCDYPSGVLPGEELRKLMIQAMVDVRAKDRKIAEREAESLLDVTKRQSGLIAERGQDAYGFLHLTFQEYLAAKHIAEDREKIWKRLRPVLHHPRWREVVLLTAGCLGILMADRKGCESLVNEIAGASSPLEDVLYRSLFLALECICDDLRISPAAQLDVIKRALALWKTTTSKLFNDRLFGLLGRLLHGSARAHVERFFLNALKDSDEDVRDAAASALGNLGPQASPEVVNALLNALKDKDEDVRSAAASALGKLGPQASPEVVNALLNALNDSQCPVREKAAKWLGRLGVADVGVISALSAAFNEDKDYDVANAAYEALLRIAAKRDREKYGEPVPCV